MEILVVSGGVSEERAVSICSGARVCEALRQSGHKVHSVQVDRALPDAALLFRAKEVACVFLCLHGGTGEDGGWQAALEAAGVRHYTGSAPNASALAMDKPRAKARVAACGVPVAKGGVWRLGTSAPVLPYPFIVKPCNGGSSVGFAIVRNEDDLKKLHPSGDLLCEEYLPGREFSVAVYGDRALPAIEIRPRGGVYDYAHKYEIGASEEICPAPLPAPQLARLQDLSLVCFSVLGLRDYARIDFKENAAGEPCFLEANTLPGMTATSLFPLAARTAGITMEALCDEIARTGAKRKAMDEKGILDNRER